ncbi:glutamine synthetase, partial [Planktomarina sp.]|nr:glutamine synthetase [Planktomarina sp.]
MVTDDMTEITRQIANGPLAQSGILDVKSVELAAALLKRVTESDIETVRVLFADQNGILRGKTIIAEALLSIFTNGLTAPVTLLLKDTSHRTVFPVWTETPGVDGIPPGAGDILMLPDPKTFRTLPWSAHSAWVFCDPR